MEKYIELITFWFTHENLWFKAKPEDDQQIKEKFGDMIKDHPDLNTIIESNDYNLLLSNILLYDQIIRHVYRGDQEKIKLLSIYSLKLSLHCIDNNLDQYFTPAQKCFILMPLRHTFELQFLEMAFSKVRSYQQEHPSPYYERFIKATIKAMSPIKAHSIEPEEIDTSLSDEKILSTLDPECVKNLTEITNIKKNDPIYKVFEIILKKLGNPKEVTISLSGGVDSMISSFILYHLSKKQTLFKITAITIDYGNREDHLYEAEFVKRWCKLLDISHYIRHITELKRDRSNDRNDYEKITRQIRFDMYRRFGYPVFLGHNQGDCLENIINNIKKTRSCGNLRGMSEISMEEGCMIVRPMLDITKKEIKEFAKTHKISHLPNSTPSWSERGKIRDQLLPFMNNFDQAIVPGLLTMADNMKEMYDIYEKSVVNNFSKQIIYEDNKVTIQLSENATEKEFGFIFWKDIMSHILKKINLPMPSNDSISAMIIRIKNLQYGKIQLSPKLELKYSKDSIVLFF